jgi:hypothetical protein
MVYLLLGNRRCKKEGKKKEGDYKRKGINKFGD